MRVPSFYRFLSESFDLDVDSLHDIVQKPYPQFVHALQSMADDPKLLAAIEAGRSDGRPMDERIVYPTSAVSLPVSRLVPCQNEIDLDKSLAYQLAAQDGRTEQLRSILDGGPVTIKAPLVTLNGKYIIDGHHRWSQVCAINSDALITAFDLRANSAPMDILKAVQLAIAASVGRIDTARVEGHNLLRVDEATLREYVRRTVSPATVAEFERVRGVYGVNGVADAVWENVRRMQKNNRPISGAPERGVMPQTDDALGDPAFGGHLSQGDINFKEPFAK